MPTTVKGVALRPVVSLNKRRYTTEVVRKAHDRLQARLADPNGQPVTMRTFHPRPAGADADVTSIAGRLTKVGLNEEGALTYEAVLADTDAGKTVAKLAKPDADGRQHLGSVSIRGYAVGPVTRDDQGNETFGDLDIVGLDCTDDPGIRGASITAASEALAAIEAPATETAEPRQFIVESVDSAIVDTTTPPPAAPAVEAQKTSQPGASDFADPGYQKDKVKRYPLDTKAHARAAWAYINMPKNADKYTGAQLKRIKSKIKAACRKFGIDVSSKEAVDRAGVMEAAIRDFVDEAYASMNVYNGQADINVGGRSDDPGDLPVLVARIATAALASLKALDPDNDGDIDGIPDGDDDDLDVDVFNIAPESAPAGRSTEATAPTTSEEDDMPSIDEIKEAMAAANAPLLEALGGLVTALTPQPAGAASGEGAPPEGTPAAPPAAAGEAAPAPAAPVTETPEQIEARIREQVRNEMLNEARANGVGERKGLVRKINEAGGEFDILALPKAEQEALYGEALVERYARFSPALALHLQDIGQP